MRWPWMSREVHEDIVRDLRTRLADSETERKRTQDEMVRLLGGKPYNYPQPGDAVEQVQTSGEEPDPLQDEADYLAYVANNKPAHFPQIMANVMAKGRPRVFPEPTQPSSSRKAEVAAAFEQAENEVKQKVNGHTTA
jgi:hypothetical protein